ncbi:MAG: hypothetical protein JOS17DRAFT_768795 [Linnemannia elongata]|nr:MAG: hypothetical protein JOS17DRAFT_768795 [Linnemannia elongata]
MSGLRVRDIVLFTDEFDPRELVKPIAIPSEGDEWIAFFTGEEFKTFWYTERVARQWQMMAESGFRHICLKKENADDLLPIHTKTPGSVGRPPMYDWSFRFCCRRHRPSSQLVIKRSSVGNDCPVEIRMRKLRGRDAVEVVYRWRHNHDDSAKARSKMPLSGIELEWVKKMAADGLDWKSIKARLRLDNWSLRQLEDQESLDALPPCLYMLYDDVRTVVYRNRTQLSRKAVSPSYSVKLWLDQIKDEGGKSMFKDEAAQSKDHYLFAWCTRFQLKIMKDNTTIVCMDSTHKTVKSLKPSPENDKVYTSAYLFTILVRDRKSQTGIPIAFMVCNSESSYIITEWLTWLKTECGLQASKFMVDCSVAESEALKRAFPLPSMEIYFCSFHVGQAWERKLRELHDMEESSRMRPALKAIRKADSEATLQEAWRKFQVSFRQAKKLIAYIKNWMEPTKLVKWVLYLRENNQHINTNNLVESWHKTFKSQYLGYARDLRPDDLVFLLQGSVDIDFRITYYKISRGLQPITLSESAATRKTKAMAIPFVDAKDMVDEVFHEKKFLVRSFSGPNESHSVCTDEDFACLYSCTCGDYTRYKEPCKHMYLVTRIYNDIEISYEGEPSLSKESATDENRLNLSLETLLSPQLLLLLQRQRAEKREADLLAKAAENARAFEDGEAELMAILQKIYQALAAKKKRKCSFQYLQETIALLHNAYLQVKMRAVQGENASE